MALDQMPNGRVSNRVSALPQQPASINSGRPVCPEYRAGWYILRCGAGSEFRARDALSDSGFSAFLPVERKDRVTLYRRKPASTQYPRFPRYLFVHVEPPLWPSLDGGPLKDLVHGFLRMD